MEVFILSQTRQNTPVARMPKLIGFLCIEYINQRAFIRKKRALFSWAQNPLCVADNTLQLRRVWYQRRNSQPFIISVVLMVRMREERKSGVNFPLKLINLLYVAFGRKSLLFHGVAWLMAIIQRMLECSRHSVIFSSLVSFLIKLLISKHYVLFR